MIELDEAFRILKISSLQEYWRLPLWEKIRRRVFEQRGKVCCRCGRDAVVVHHTDYPLDTMLGNSIKCLIPLCQGCHCRIHEGKHLKDALSSPIPKPKPLSKKDRTKIEERKRTKTKRKRMAKYVAPPEKFWWNK